jgi:hypothetical protein
MLSSEVAPMPEHTKSFAMFPHDWHSADYVAEWVVRDAARDPERRPLLQQMLSFAPFPRDADLEVLEKIFACYRAVHTLLKPRGCFLNCDRFVEGVQPHLAELREAGFDRVECPWRDPPRAIIVADRSAR